MSKTLVLSSVLVIAGATTGAAQSFSGGELGLEFQSFNDLDTNTTSYYGGAEFDVTPQVAIAVDFSFLSASNTSENPTNATLHGIYKIPGMGSIGAFYGQDTLAGDAKVDIYGAEGAFDYGSGQIEAFFGIADQGNDNENSFLGANVDYNFGNGFALLGSIDRLNTDTGTTDTSTTLLEAGGRYTMPNGPTVFAKLGRVSQETDSVSGDDTYVSVGASIGFGPNGGMTFSPRNIYTTSALSF